MVEEVLVGVVVVEVFVVGGGGGARNLFDHLEQQEPRIERFYIMDNVDFCWLVG